MFGVDADRLVACALERKIRGIFDSYKFTFYNHTAIPVEAVITNDKFRRTGSFEVNFNLEGELGVKKEFIYDNDQPIQICHVPANSEVVIPMTTSVGFLTVFRNSSENKKIIYYENQPVDAFLDASLELEMVISKEVQEGTNLGKKLKEESINRKRNEDAEMVEYLKDYRRKHNLVGNWTPTVGSLIWLKRSDGFWHPSRIIGIDYNNFTCNAGDQTKLIPNNQFHLFIKPYSLRVGLLVMVKRSNGSWTKGNISRMTHDAIVIGLDDGLEKVFQKGSEVDWIKIN